MAAVSGRPIDVHTWSTPNGWKIPIMLEECGLPYRIVPVNIAKNEQFTPDFLALSPNNKIPAIVDPDGPGGTADLGVRVGRDPSVSRPEDRSILPVGRAARVAVDEWLFWQVAGFGPMLGQTHHFKIYAPEKVPYAIDRFTAEAKRLYGVLERRLEGRPYLADDYSIADIATLTWAKLNFKQGVDIDALPNVARWLETVLARPAVQRGLAAI